MKRFLRAAALVVLVLGVAAAGGVWYAQHYNQPHPATYVAKDSTLRQPWLFFYPSRAAEPARAVVVLFGNDVAFWEPHQMLAWRFSEQPIDVIGVDLRKYLATLPEPEPARDSAFAANMASLISRARHELNADSLPLVVGGHSFGAELAFWTAWKIPPTHLVGVLALNSRATGHLFITPQDWMNKEASGPYSFSAVAAAKELAPNVRIALVRSGKDPFRAHDPEFEAAGGGRLEHFVIPMATHSMTTMLTAGPIISRALSFLLDSTAAKP